jgi:outer membrane receptor for ferrienterochelin and colicin
MHIEVVARHPLVHAVVLALACMPMLAQASEAEDQQAVKAAKSAPLTLDKVTVAATRYSATDMQMAASNTTNVLSAEDLKYTAVHNIAEALGLMPGVNVVNTGQSYFGGIDGAARGEGMFASVRGLNAEYNVNLINGVNVAQGMPYSRSVQLRLLPPSGLQTIVLNKTPPRLITAKGQGAASVSVVVSRAGRAITAKTAWVAVLPVTGIVVLAAKTSSAFI